LVEHVAEVRQTYDQANLGMASINAAEAAAEQIAKREKQLEDRELLEEDRQWAL